MLERRVTKQIFAAATDALSYLDIGALETLHNKYPYRPEYGYDAPTLKVRGIKRAAQILRLPGAHQANSFLELGCWDGMVSCGLCCKGKIATAIDNRDAGFDQRASLEGVSLIQMDAANLQFKDESFNFVFSYDSFEHFSSPEDVLREAIRVVRNGGYIYLDFGPLYYSPLGQHIYTLITVPYCQFLWPKKLLNEFCDQKGLGRPDYTHVNGWSLESYRKLWSKYSHILKRVRYNERFDLSHLSLIRRFPSCFKSKSKHFENFIVAEISVLFQKLDRELPTNGMNSNIKS
jgi:ubiquinone/menaquinone biosynthesis C-methylase UbiE